MTRRAVVPVRTRMLRIARALIEGREVTSIWIRREFGVCRVQAGRDMQALRAYLPVVECRRRDECGVPRGQAGFKAVRLP
jgi:predicted DNA-binding transcriptional regulator YafY